MPEAPRVNLTAHDARGPLPCLCRRCFHQSGERAEAGGMSFTRAQVEAEGRTLFYWLPDELLPDTQKVAESVQGVLAARLRSTG